MVNDLRALMREVTSHPPQYLGDLADVVGTGRRRVRVRVRRASAAGGTALAAGAIALASMSWLNPAPTDLAAAGLPRADGPVVGLATARPAVEGTDYRTLTSHTNEDLSADNGQYFDGVTEDGLILFRDGPRSGQLYPRFALMDPATGEKDWLPALDIAQQQTLSVELSEDRLVLASLQQAMVYVFDRNTRMWSSTQWPELPRHDQLRIPLVGPDGRLYVQVPATQGRVPEGGWPMGPDGEADDSSAEGDAFDLWSVSPTDGADVRDEHLRVGSVAFTTDSLVWTDSTNGAAGHVHVRNMTTGAETSFDPALGERCNLLAFSAAGERIAMSQYCGTYDGGVRDDRVQVVTTEGDPIITVQDSGVDGGQLVSGGDYLTLRAYDQATGGVYVYDFEAGRLLRLSEANAVWQVGQGPTPSDQFLWNEPAGRKVPSLGNSGATVHLSEMIR